MGQPWYPSSISLLMALITGEGLTPEVYFLIGNIGVPIAVFSWLIAFTNFLCKEKQKIILLLYGILAILFEIYLFYSIFTDPSLIGELQGPVDVQYKSFVMFFLVFTILVMFITGILFARASIKYDDPEIKLKGKLLIAAFVSWTVGAILDAALPLGIVTLTIARLILISSSLEFYCAFIMPKWIKNIYLKEEEIIPTSKKTVIKNLLDEFEDNLDGLVKDFRVLKDSLKKIER